MSLPQRISYITLGARDMAVLRAFYTRLGWQERPGSNDDFATYEAGSILLALYPIDQLGQEAAPREPVPEYGWNGVTLGVNVPNTQAVDESFRLALAAGARAVSHPVEREWGGYSGYVADPEGNRWEITWTPEVQFRHADFSRAEPRTTDARSGSLSLVNMGWSTDQVRAE